MRWVSPICDTSHVLIRGETIATPGWSLLPPHPISADRVVEPVDLSCQSVLGLARRLLCKGLDQFSLQCLGERFDHGTVIAVPLANR